MTRSASRRLRPALEAAGLALLVVAGVALERTGVLAGLLAAATVFWFRRRRTRELDLVRAGVAEAAQGVRPEAVPGLSEETEDVFADLGRFASLVASEREGNEKARLLARTLFDELPVGLVVVDRAQRVLDVNPAARHILGIPDGTRVGALVDLAREPEVQRLFRSVLDAPGDGGAGQAVVRRDDGGEGRHLELTVRAVPGEPSSGEAAAVGVLRDVTERERTELMRRRFVADVSHELRTPVATVRAAAETLAGEDGLAPDLRRLVEILQRQSSEMQELVSDLTDLSQIEAGAVALALDRLPVRSLLCGVLRDLAPAAQAKGIELALEAPPDATVLGDHRRLTQVFRNLVDNAIKFSPRGSRVDVLAEGGASGADGAPCPVQVHVVDRGIGIAKADQAKVFQRFYRVDPSRAKSVPGTGLGLAIVKHLLILHGGSIRVESEPGRGSRFSVTLPAAPAAEKVLQEAS